MRRTRYDRLLAGVAMVAALALMSGPVAAQSAAEIEAAVPMPDTSQVPPPTVQDVAPATSGAAPAADPVPAPQTAVEAPPVAAAAPTVATPAAPIPPVVPAESVAVAPATPAPGADAAVSDKLREIGTGRYDRIFGDRRERAGVESFYASRNHAPLWVSGASLNEKGRAAVTYLSRVEADGLEPSDYPTPELRGASTPEALAEAELRLTDSLLAYTRHAQSGRVHYSRIAADIEYSLDRPDPASVLSKLAAAPNLAAALDDFQPPHAGYKALKAQLAKARGQDAEPAPAIRIAAGPTLRVQKKPMMDARVADLRERLSVSGESDIYDKPLADAVAKFQREHGLPGNGALIAATVDSLNGQRRDRSVDVIVANMERWRWLPRDLGRIHVMVNVPDYTLRIMRDNKVYWSTRIVVGKPSQATPVMSASMKFITVNPTWNVPPSIIQNEYLPALAQDPNALSRIGLKMTRNPDGTVRIYQPPGDRNALGRIRFNFPNKFLVYQHDTPDKHLFAHDKRAYSHGCMRVQDPLKYGEMLLSLARPSDGYSAERLRKMFGGSEININFPEQIPVHLTYQTAFVDDAGKLAIRDDIYGRDARMIAAVKGEARKVAEIPMSRPPTNFSKPVRMPSNVARSQGFDGMERGPGGQSFFDMLFGGGREADPAQTRQRPRRADAGDRRNFR